MFKALVSVLLVAIAATNGAIISTASNTGLNLLSANGHILQNDIQNINAGGPVLYDGLYAAGVQPLALSVVPVVHRLGAPVVVDSVLSAGSNLGANIMSTNSDIAQNQIQNVAIAGLRRF